MRIQLEAYLPSNIRSAQQSRPPARSQLGTLLQVTNRSNEATEDTWAGFILPCTSRSSATPLPLRSDPINAHQLRQARLGHGLAEILQLCAACQPGSIQHGAYTELANRAARAVLANRFSPLFPDPRESRLLPAALAAGPSTASKTREAIGRIERYLGSCDAPVASPGTPSDQTGARALAGLCCARLMRACGLPDFTAATSCPPDNPAEKTIVSFNMMKKSTTALVAPLINKLCACDTLKSIADHLHAFDAMFQRGGTALPANSIAIVDVVRASLAEVESYDAKQVGEALKAPPTGHFQGN